MIHVGALRIEAADLSEFRLSLCDLCWNQLTVGERLYFAENVRRNYVIGEALEAIGELCNALADAKRSNPFGLN